MKTILYQQVLKSHLQTLTQTISSTQQQCVLAQLKHELQAYEDSLAQKTLKALQTMNSKLQREITNFVNLKMRIAFLKSGVAQECGGIIAEDLFSELEDQILLKMDEVEFTVAE